MTLLLALVSVIFENITQDKVFYILAIICLVYSVLKDISKLMRKYYG